MQATPQTDTVSPVSVADFAAFIGVDVSDPLLGGLLVAATDGVIRYINQDLTQRTWVGVVPVPAKVRPQVSPYIDPSNTFELPYTGLIRVHSVSDGTGSDLWFEVQDQRRPAKITVHGWDYQTELHVEYVAGLSTIPSAIKTAIMMLASFLYDHRGSCDATDGIQKSGAAMLLRPYRVEVAI